MLRHDGAVSEEFRPLLLHPSKVAVKSTGSAALEHSGKLIKRVEVNNHQSPFEKFLNTQVPEDAEVIEYDEIEVLPQRPILPDKPIDEKKNKLKNKKRREARKWRERAEAVGIEPPKQGRQTPAQRKQWQEKIAKREKALGVKPL